MAVKLLCRQPPNKNGYLSVTGDADQKTGTHIKMHHDAERSHLRDYDSYGDKLSMEMEKESLLELDRLPSWQQDNRYILTGYRPASGSLLSCLQSITSIHNETINIHTHLLGSILFFALPIAIYTRLTPRYEKATTADIVVFSTFFFGVAICFLLSATFHTLNNHSQETAAFANQLDYLGIVILIWGSTIPTVYYGFYCDEAVRDMYWMMISVLATACAITTLHPKFRHPTLRPYRALMYACLGLSASVFIAHGLIMHGWETQKARMSIDWMGLMAILNLVGAFIYALRIPEKWYPNQHDLFGSSHQIFHVMVVLAGLAHMFGLLRAFDHVHSSGFGCTSS